MDKDITTSGIYMDHNMACFMLGCNRNKQLTNINEPIVYEKNLLGAYLVNKGSEKLNMVTTGQNN